MRETIETLFGRTRGAVATIRPQNRNSGKGEAERKRGGRRRLTCVGEASELRQFPFDDFAGQSQWHLWNNDNSRWPLVGGKMLRRVLRELSLCDRRSLLQLDKGNDLLTTRCTLGTTPKDCRSDHSRVSI
jgi:hypothetical protein